MVAAARARHEPRVTRSVRGKGFGNLSTLKAKLKAQVSASADFGLASYGMTRADGDSWPLMHYKLGDEQDQASFDLTLAKYRYAKAAHQEAASVALAAAKIASNATVKAAEAVGLLAIAERDRCSAAGVDAEGGAGDAPEQEEEQDDNANALAAFLGGGGGGGGSDRIEAGDVVRCTQDPHKGMLAMVVVYDDSKGAKHAKLTLRFVPTSDNEHTAAAATKRILPAKHVKKVDFETGVRYKCAVDSSKIVRRMYPALEEYE